MFIGILLLIMGALILLERMGVIPGGAWDYFWPVVVIALGLSMIFKRRVHRHG
jgi:hypothetical protein